MIDFRRFRVPVLILFGVALVSLFFLVPISVPMTISAPGRIVPAAVWVVSKQPDGSVGTILRDYHTGKSDLLTTYNAERGNVVRFHIFPELKHGDTVQQGDTLGIIESGAINQRLAQFRGELSILRATLQAQQTGEKAPLIEEAQNELELAREELTVQRQITERQCALYDKNLISSEEFEIARGRERIAELEVAAVEARVAALQSGAKPELTAVTRAEIKAIQSQIAALEHQLRQNLLRTPITGSLSFQTGGDTLMMVEERSHMVVMAIPMKYRQTVGVQDTVNFTFTEKQEVSGTIIRIEDRVDIVGQEQVFAAYVRLPDQQSVFPTRLVTVGEIAGTKLSPLAYIRQVIRHNITR